jgi:hypothetical protein
VIVVSDVIVDVTVVVEGEVIVDVSVVVDVTVVVVSWTVKEVEAEFPLVSVATTVWLPPAEVGTMNVAKNEPDEEAVMMEGEVIGVVASYFIVIMEYAVKPEPLTVTDDPRAPAEGLNKMKVLKIVVAELIYQGE